jgi:hypothetical protein
MDSVKLAYVFFSSSDTTLECPVCLLEELFVKRQIKLKILLLKHHVNCAKNVFLSSRTKVNNQSLSKYLAALQIFANEFRICKLLWVYWNWKLLKLYFPKFVLDLDSQRCAVLYIKLICITESNNTSWKFFNLVFPLLDC